MAETESPFSRVPEPGIHEHRVPVTDAEGVVVGAGATARSIRPLPHALRIALVIVGIVIVVGLPFVTLLAS